MNWKWLFFSVRGRISRKPFWIGILLLFALIWGPLLFLGSVHAPNANIHPPPTPPSPLLEAAAIVVVSWWLVLLVFGDIPIAVKRLHDLDMSAWWVLFKFIPVGNLLFFLMLGVLKGTGGPNRFGPDPLGNIPDAQFQ
jgi:uncharacterized membrane protein YhaH (DUF805 family)